MRFDRKGIAQLQYTLHYENMPMQYKELSDKVKIEKKNQLIFFFFFFNVFAQNFYCGYIFCSNEYPQPMF